MIRPWLFVVVVLLHNCIAQGEDTTNDNPFTELLETPHQSPPMSPSSPSSKMSRPVHSVLTRVVNAFPPSGENGSLVSLILEEDEIEGVTYGSVGEKETTMHAVEDFVIHFTHPNNRGR